MLNHILLYFASFLLLWVGAGFIISSVDKISKKLKLSSFAFSFFILGILTSIPEFAVGITAVAEHKAEVFVGNLIGGIPVLFLFVIPLLAIFGNGIKLQKSLDQKNLILSFIVMLTPAFFVMDRRVTNFEGGIMITAYALLFILVQKKGGIFDARQSKILDIHAYSYNDIIKVILGVATVFIASQIIVDKTLFFADFLNISPFYVSLVFLSLGTNLPELTLAIKSIILRKKDVAFGDYVGSAAANTLLFGVFTLLHNGEVITIDNFIKTFAIMSLGLALFFYFSRSEHRISRIHGFILIGLYLLFIASEVF